MAGAAGSGTGARARPEIASAGRKPPPRARKPVGSGRKSPGDKEGAARVWEDWRRRNGEDGRLLGRANG